MATTVIKTIGPGGDYASLAAAGADTTTIPLNLVTADLMVYLRVLSGTELATTSTMVFGDRTWDSTRRIILEPQTGQGFGDHANKLTNALTYDATKGAAIKYTGDNYDTPAWDLRGISEIRGLQFKRDDQGSGAGGYLIRADGAFIHNNIIDAPRPSQSEPQIQCAGFVNNVFIGRAGFGSGAPFVLSTRFNNGWNGSTSGVQIVANTVVLFGGSGRFVTGGGGAPVIKDNALFGLSLLSDNGGWGATYTATDMTTLAGTGNLTSLAASNQFVSPTADFRVKAGAALIGAGTRDAANTGDLDIVGSARSTSTPTIGAWEYASGGGSAPSITAQPSNQSVSAGATATFSITATGATSYQWQRNPGGTGSWADISGATSASYTTPATTVTGGSANNTDQYRCVATNSNGSTTSSAATLTVTSGSTAPVFSVHPANQSAIVGATATFTATSSGSPTPTYQWQRSTDGGTNWNDITGATSASYTTPAVGLKGAGANAGDRFRRKDTNSAGSATSNAATLTVTGGAASMTSQPLSRNNGGLSGASSIAWAKVVNTSTGEDVTPVLTGLTVNSSSLFTLTGLPAGTYVVFYQENGGRYGWGVGVAA